jgi:hypothetical protein
MTERVVSRLLPRNRGSEIQNDLFQAELFADSSCERVLDLGMSRHWHNPPVRWINVKVVICAVTFQVAAMFGKTSHQLSPLHSEISISCLSLGTAVLSAASSTINRYASRIMV